MDCMEAIALKSSFLLKAANSKLLYNDVWCLTGINGTGGGGGAAVADDFPVEDLLNLDSPEIEFQEENEGSSKGNSNVPSSTFSGAGEFDCLSAGELTVQDLKVEDLENLEWLSRIVDDSVSELSMLCPAGSFPCLVNRPERGKTGVPSFALPVCRKPRSKRSRANRRLSPPLSAADSISATSSSYGSTGLPSFRFMGPVHDAEFLLAVEKPPDKRQKRKTESGLGRRCTHCQVQRTPQWRTGPLGPKTLCNACGVRFKSGRLYPEYRPACSPTFSQELHSNSHRKVLEMRRRKEEPGWSWAVQAQTVGSFE